MWHCWLTFSTAMSQMATLGYVITMWRGAELRWRDCGSPVHPWDFQVHEWTCSVFLLILSCVSFATNRFLTNARDE